MHEVLLGPEQLVAITGCGRKEWIHCIDSFCHEGDKKVKKSSEIKNKKKYKSKH